MIIANNEKINQHLLCQSLNKKQTPSGNMLFYDTSQEPESPTIDQVVSDFTRGTSVPLLYFYDENGVFALAQTLLKASEPIPDIPYEFNCFLFDELSDSSQKNLGPNIKKLSKMFMCYSVDTNAFASSYSQDISFISHRAFTYLDKHYRGIVLNSYCKAPQKMFFCFTPNGLYIIDVTCGYTLSINEEQFRIKYNTPCIVSVSKWQALHTGIGCAHEINAIYINESRGNCESIECSCDTTHPGQLLTNQLLHGFYAIAMFLETLKPHQLHSKKLIQTWLNAKNNLTITDFLSTPFSGSTLPFNTIIYFMDSGFLEALLDEKTRKFSIANSLIEKFQEFLRAYRNHCNQQNIVFSEMYRSVYEDFGVIL